MIIFAVIGVIVNSLAAYFTSKGKSLNQKTVNLHMLEDVFNWVVVLIGAVLIRFTDLSFIDPIMSIFVATFVLFNSLKNFKEILDLFLERIPKYLSLDEVKKRLIALNDVIDVHHIHIWSIDGSNNYATMHVVVKKQNVLIKEKIREILKEYQICHVTIELETENEICKDNICSLNIKNDLFHHHHHH